MKEIYDRCDNVQKIYEETESYGRIQFVIEIEKLRNQIEFLSKRDNKLQQIEQMFQNSIVDLSELSKLIKEN
jgi:hypothetical protein